jgi:DNA ligase (NAD+)
MPRARAAERIRKEGGTVATGISRKVDFLVAGADAGGKRTKAKELGIPILTEEEFLAMLGGKE